MKNNNRQKNLLWLFCILSATFIAYLPALNNGFVYDDPLYIANNPVIWQLSVQNIELFFSQFHEGLYLPLTLLSLAIDFHFSEFNPFLYHFTNLLLHVVNTFLVFWLVRCLVSTADKSPTGLNIDKNSLIIAGITALLFGVHTLHVESVAWISERKDVLYALFFIASLICYVKYIKLNRNKYYLYALILFFLAIISKAQAVSLSVTLIAIDFLLDRRLLDKKVILEKIPFLSISLIFGLIGINGIQSSKAVFTETGVFEQVLYACYGFTQYVFKLTIPYNLSAFYPYPETIGVSFPHKYWLYLIPVLAIMAVFVYSIKHSRQVTFGIAFFVINIFLVLQLVPNAPTIMADRYSYVASIGFFFLIGLGYNQILAKKIQFKTTIQICLTAYLLFLTVNTYNRCKIWKDDLVLFDNVLSQYPNVSSALNNRGNAKHALGDYGGAIADFNKLLLRNPDYFEAYYNRGNSKNILGDLTGAIEDYNKAIQLKSDYFEAYSNRGVAKDKMKDYPGAIADYDKAILLNPDYPEALFNRANDKAILGDLKGALQDYDKTIRLKPAFSKAYLNRGMAKIQIGEKQGGCSDLQHAAQLGSEVAYQQSMKFCKN